MPSLEAKFAKLGTDHAPGQEVRQGEAPPAARLRGEPLPGAPVDFSHGDVNDTAFPPAPGALDAFIAGERRGGAQAYTEYRGEAALREQVARKLSDFTGRPVASAEELIFTPGTQGALFLALGATVNAGDRVAIVRPDYFANRKLVTFLGAEVVPVRLDYLGYTDRAGLDLDALEKVFKSGVRTFLFSNPNNPTGVIYAPDEIAAIAELADRHGVTVIVDELYARLVYSGETFTHLCAAGIAPDQVLTILGPSKTESLSGYRLGVAFGAPRLIERAERLQAIVSLRAPGYSQAVLRTWFEEPKGWLADRIRKHQAIRDDLLAEFRKVAGVAVRTPAGGSYLFPRLPALDLPLHDFVGALRVQGGAIVTPGTEFDPDATDSIRLNFSQHHQAAVQAVGRIGQLVERYRTA
jgi:aspartate/methionine/tyrosine aminotransferase